MSRLTYALANDWCWLRDSGGIDLLRLSFVNDGWHVSIAVALLGFGIGLAYWKRAAREWKPVAPISPARSYAWESIETDGWAGEPQGMEKAP